MSLRIALASLVSFLWIVNLPINTIRQVLRAMELMVVWWSSDDGEGEGAFGQGMLAAADSED